MRQLTFAIFLFLFGTVVSAEDSSTNLETQYIFANQVAHPELNIVEFLHDDFAGKYQNLSDFLQFNAGVQTRSSGIGNNVSLSIRGSNHLQVRFVIDGHEINDAQYGGFDINKLPLQQINSIKIIKDNSSGIGGTIILETLSSSGEKGSNISTSISSFDTYENSFTHYFSGLGNSAVNITRLTSDADYEYPVDSPFDDPTDSGRVEPLKNNKFEKSSLLYKWSLNSWENTDTGIKLQLTESKKNLPNYQQNRADNNAYLKESELSSQAFINSLISENISNKLSLNHTRKNETYSDPNGLIGVGSHVNKYNSIISHIKNTSTLKLNAFTLDFNIALKEETFEDENTLIPNSVKCLSDLSTCDIQSEQVSQSIGVSSFWESQDKNHEITVSGDALNLKKQQVKLFSNPDKLTSSNTYTNWSTAYSYHGLDHSSVRIGLSKSLRTPTLFELFGNRGLVKSNINLKPEISNSLNINLSNASKFATIENNLYFRKLSDAIVAQFSGGVGSYKNLSNADILGLETKVTTYLKGLDISVTSIQQDSSVKSEINGFNKKKLAGIFHNSISASAAYQYSETLTLTYQYQHDDNLYVDTANLEKHNGRITHNARINYNTQSIHANFSIENILDSRFKNQQNRPAPGLIFYSSIQYTF